ncbi:MAG: hypothetical protein KF762_07375 [Acidobacteria bacterium]|nr:hypothetical protein [Acidobacteriota bacterium]
MKKSRFPFSLSIVVFLVAGVQAQRVVYVCPEGTYLSEVFGYIECKPFNDRGQGREEPRPERPSIASTTLGVAMIGSRVLADLARVVKNPAYKGYAEGEWFFEEPSNGESCSATFMRRGVGVTVLGPSRSLPGAFLIFFGPNLPTPPTLTKRRVTLSQTGGNKPATVQALSSAFPPVENYGSIIFQVPTAEAALNNIEDVHKFGVAIDGKVLAEIEWNGGHTARDRLRKCVELRK